LNRLNWNCSIEFSTLQLRIFTRHGRADERIFSSPVYKPTSNSEQCTKNTIKWIIHYHKSLENHWCKTFITLPPDDSVPFVNIIPSCGSALNVDLMGKLWVQLTRRYATPRRNFIYTVCILISRYVLVTHNITGDLYRYTLATPGLEDQGYNIVETAAPTNCLLRL
jgi:hypothetical protein